MLSALDTTVETVVDDGVKLVVKGNGKFGAAKGT